MDTYVQDGDIIYDVRPRDTSINNDHYDPYI